MKYFLLLITGFLLLNNALADTDTIKLCTNMLKQKQEQMNTANKITDKQANTYCECVIPKLQQFTKSATPTQQELNNLYSQCMNKAGIKPNK